MSTAPSFMVPRGDVVQLLSTSVRGVEAGWVRKTWMRAISRNWGSAPNRGVFYAALDDERFGALRREGSRTATRG